LTPLMLVGYLMARAVRLGRVNMPESMLREIAREERR